MLTGLVGTIYQYHGYQGRDGLILVWDCLFLPVFLFRVVDIHYGANGWVDLGVLLLPSPVFYFFLRDLQLFLECVSVSNSIIMRYNTCRQGYSHGSRCFFLTGTRHFGIETGRHEREYKHCSYIKEIIHSYRRVLNNRVSTINQKHVKHQTTTVILSHRHKH